MMHTMDNHNEKKSVTLICGNPKNKVDLEIKLDELGQNIVAPQSQFSNYCGVMVRTRIFILIFRWDEVPKAKIDELWLNIKYIAMFLILLLTSFKEISSKSTETTKLNKYPPQIVRYHGMKPQWEKEMEFGESMEFHNIRSERARNFILARLKRDPIGIYSLPSDLYSLTSELMKIEVEAMMEAKMEPR
uniref:Uncharacterized protein n=1 Tax=Lactuca sativa TaxID=4236 RepID=A0A9R1V3X3_LACSA|nr:hypothetical protein LSAT_V11C700378120 [Lactuca sativa]